MNDSVSRNVEQLLLQLAACILNSCLTHGRPNAASTTQNKLLLPLTDSSDIFTGAFMAPYMHTLIVMCKSRSCRFGQATTLEPSSAAFSDPSLQTISLPRNQPPLACLQCHQPVPSRCSSASEASWVEV